MYQVLLCALYYKQRAEILAQEGPESCVLHVREERSALTSHRAVFDELQNGQPSSRAQRKNSNYNTTTSYCLLLGGCVFMLVVPHSEPRGGVGNMNIHFQDNGQMVKPSSPCLLSLMVNRNTGIAAPTLTDGARFVHTQD